MVYGLSLPHLRLSVCVKPTGDAVAGEFWIRPFPPFVMNLLI